MSSSETPPTSAGRTLAVIIGRRGSRGLPGKNAMTVAGRPMLTYSIDAARSCHLVDQTIVSSDCPDLIRTAQQEGVAVVERPSALAADNTPIDDAVRHAIEGHECSTIIILYANVPVRPVGLVERAIQTLWSSEADSVQSYASVGKYHPYWEVALDESTGRVSAYVENDVYRRQDLPPLFIPDGGVIAVTRDALMGGASDPHPHAFLGKDRRGIRNDPGAVIDIDSEIDLEVARAILSKQPNARIAG